jgi:hypothetical protein
MKKIPVLAGLAGSMLSLLLLLPVFPGCSQQHDPRDTVKGNGTSTDNPLPGTRWILSGESTSAYVLRFIDQDSAALGEPEHQYSWNDAEQKGLVTGLGEFTFDEENFAIKFSAYKNSGSAVFNCYLDTLEGTRWRWMSAGSDLKFNSDTEAVFSETVYTCVFDGNTGTGSIATLGTFSFNENKKYIVFDDFKPETNTETPLKVEFQRRLYADNNSSQGSIPLDSLKGTVWIWDSPWGRRTLVFDSSELKVTYTGQEGDSYTEKYTYDRATKKGVMDYYGEAGFELSADNQTMHFIEWKKYGHGCDYTRLTG